MDQVVKYKIGDKAWRGMFDAAESSITCPDCGGTGQIRCIMFDGMEHSIECEGCKCGYLPPTGRVKTYDRVARAELVTIDGFEVMGSKVEYKINYSGGCYNCINAADLFDTEEEALKRGKELAAEYDRQEREEINRKEKDTKSWAWHVHYYRRQIRDAEKIIAYATAKLNVAKIKAKEPAEEAQPEKVSE